MATKRRRSTTYNSGGTPWFKRLAAILLGIVILCGVAYGIGYAVTKQANPAKGFDKENKIEQTTDDEAAQGEMLVTYNNKAGAPLQIVPYTANDVAAATAVATAAEPVAESIGNAVTLQAVITPSDASIQTCTWGLAWTNAQESWTLGKNVTEYVNVQPQSDTRKCEITCLQMFESPITLVCTSDDNEDGTISATCKINFVRPITGGSFEFKIGYNYISDSEEGSYSDINLTRLYWSNTTELETVTYAQTFRKATQNDWKPYDEVEDDVSTYEQYAFQPKSNELGTVNDYISAFIQDTRKNIKSITITLADDVKSAVQSALGKKADSFEVTNKFEYSISEVFAALVTNTDGLTMYNTLQKYFTQGQAVLQYNVTVTGARSKKDYTFAYGLAVNCTSLRKQVQGINPLPDIDFYEN